MDAYIGEIRIFCFNFAPQGWLYCDGQSLSIPAYTPLFAVIGITYGGDGKTNFKVPNLTDRAVIGTTGTMNQQSGQVAVALAPSQCASHNHLLYGTTAPATSKTAAGNFIAASGDIQLKPYLRATANPTAVPPTTAPPLVGMAANSLTAAGGGTAHENRQPYLSMGFFICFDGEFPPFP